MKASDISSFEHRRYISGAFSNLIGWKRHLLTADLKQGLQDGLFTWIEFYEELLQRRGSENGIPSPD